jgi:hypothetical protein
MIAKRRAAASSGCLGQTPVTRCFVNGKAVSRFSICVEDRLASGLRRERAER